MRPSIAGNGGTNGWRGAALACTPRPDGISPYHALQPRNVKAGGSRELPSAMLCRSVSVRSTNKQPDAGSFRGPRVIATFSPPRERWWTAVTEACPRPACKPRLGGRSGLAKCWIKHASRFANSVGPIGEPRPTRTPCTPSLTRAHLFY
jgi:hypothetical protein